jgi:hypothetical protein
MELYPCPFCGGKAVVDARDDPERSCRWFWVSCRICQVGQPQSLYTVEGTAEAAWNDRCDELLVNFPKSVRNS